MKMGNKSLDILRHRYFERHRDNRTPAKERGYAHAPSPTLTYPGTEERMQIYEDRARAGFSMFHPKDNNGREV